MTKEELLDYKNKHGFFPLVMLSRGIKRKEISSFNNKGYVAKYRKGQWLRIKQIDGNDVICQKEHSRKLGVAAFWQSYYRFSISDIELRKYKVVK